MAGSFDSDSTSQPLSVKKKSGSTVDTNTSLRVVSRRSFSRSSSLARLYLLSRRLNSKWSKMTIEVVELVAIDLSSTILFNSSRTSSRQSGGRLAMLSIHWDWPDLVRSMIRKFFLLSLTAFQSTVSNGGSSVVAKKILFTTIINQKLKMIHSGSR